MSMSWLSECIGVDGSIRSKTGRPGALESGSGPSRHTALPLDRPAPPFGLQRPFLLCASRTGAHFRAGRALSWQQKARRGARRGIRADRASISARGWAAAACFAGMGCHPHVQESAPSGPGGGRCARGPAGFLRVPRSGRAVGSASGSRIGGCGTVRNRHTSPGSSRRTRMGMKTGPEPARLGNHGDFDP